MPAEPALTQAQQPVGQNTTLDASVPCLPCASHAGSLLKRRGTTAQLEGTLLPPVGQSTTLAASVACLPFASHEGSLLKRPGATAKFEGPLLKRQRGHMASRLLPETHTSAVDLVSRHLRYLPVQESNLQLP